MLLVISLKKDTSYLDVVEHFKFPVVKLDIDADPLPELSMLWNGERFEYRLGDINLTEITSVWYRVAGLTYNKPTNEPYWLFNRLSREESVRYLFGILDNAFWLPNPYVLPKAENKMFQLEVAKRVGLEIPETLISSSPDDVLAFRELVGDMVVKPLVKQVVPGDEGKIKAFFTTRIAKESFVSFSLLPHSPAIFQKEIVRRFDLRVIVVGDKVFALEIHQVGKKKGGVDYRVNVNEDLEFYPHGLPDEIAHKCVDLIKGLGLSMGAIDLINDLEGRYIFLENNAQGSWKFVEEHGGYEISKAIAELLV